MRLATLLGPELKKLIEESPDQLRELLEEIHPEDVADALADLAPGETAKVLALIPARDGAPIFERLRDHEQVAVAGLVPIEKLAYVASAMTASRRGHLMRVLPDELDATLLQVLVEIAPDAAVQIQAMGRWGRGTVGYLMSPSFMTLQPGNTVAQALAAIRAHDEQTHETEDDVYVTDDQKRLTGKVSVRALAFANPARPISDVFERKIVSVGPEDTHREAARRMAKYDVHALPVVDGQGALVGMIGIDDVIDALTKETTNEVQRLGAVEPLDLPYFRTTFWTFIRKRGVWLVVLFLEEFFTQTALRYYDPVFEAIKGASYYVPLLISTGGNSGSQSSTLVIRGLAVGELRPRDWWRILYREAGMGLILGIGLGAIGFLRVLMYRDQHVDFALTVAVTLVGIVMTGCTVGSMLPLVLRRFGVDPATSSTPFIASLVDVLGIIVFLHARRKSSYASVQSPPRRADTAVEICYFQRHTRDLPKVKVDWSEVIRDWSPVIARLDAEDGDRVPAMTDQQPLIVRCAPPVTDWSSVIRDHGAVIEDHEALIEDHETVIGNHETVIWNRETVIGHHETVIGNHETVIGNHETVIRHHETAIEDHETVIGNHETAIEDHETREEGGPVRGAGPDTTRLAVPDRSANSPGRPRAAHRPRAAARDLLSRPGSDGARHLRLLPHAVLARERDAAAARPVIAGGAVVAAHAADARARLRASAHGGRAEPLRVRPDDGTRRGAVALALRVGAVQSERFAELAFRDVRVGRRARALPAGRARRSRAPAARGTAGDLVAVRIRIVSVLAFEVHRSARPRLRRAGRACRRAPTAAARASSAARRAPAAAARRARAPSRRASARAAGAA